MSKLYFRYNLKNNTESSCRKAWYTEDIKCVCFNTIIGVNNNSSKNNKVHQRSWSTGYGEGLFRKGPLGSCSIMNTTCKPRLEEQPANTLQAPLPLTRAPLSHRTSLTSTSPKINV